MIQETLLFPGKMTGKVVRGLQLLEESRGSHQRHQSQYREAGWKRQDLLD